MFEDIIVGINHIWNNKFAEAEGVFSSKKDSSPRYALHYAEVAFLRSFITADTTDTETAIHRLKEAKRLAESQLKHYENRTMPPGVPGNDRKTFLNSFLDCRIVFGDALYMGAVLQLTRDSKIKGAFNMRKSWKVFEECLKMMKEIKDSKEVFDEELQRCLHFGAGFFYFAMSIIPQKFLKLIELVGFRADRDLGLKYIRECHDAGGIRSPFATIVLLFNNLLLPRGLANPAKYLREADALIKESLIKYPQGSLFQVMGSHCARKQCNVEEGITFMLNAIENCNSLGSAPLIYKYELANCYTMSLKWETAAQHFEPLVQEEKFQVRALAALQLASCYFMMGQRDKAIALLQRIPSLAKKNSSVDPIVVHQAQRFLANGGWLSAFELLFIRRDLAKMDQIMPQTLALLEAQAANTQALKPITVDGKQNKGISGLFSGLSLGSKKTEQTDNAADDRAAYLLLKGAMLKSLETVDEAIACFKEAISLESVVKEKFYVVYALYELAESLYHQGQLKEAQEAIKKCNNFSGYDWEDPLKVRLRVTMDQLKKGGVLQDDDDADGAELKSSSSTPNLATPPPASASASGSSSSSSSSTAASPSIPTSDIPNNEIPASC